MSAKKHSPTSSVPEPSKSNVPIVVRLTRSQSDSNLLDWVEEHKAQLWFDKHRNLWTCQVMYHPHVIQPSRLTVRGAIVDARFKLDELKYPAT